MDEKLLVIMPQRMTLDESKRFLRVFQYAVQDYDYEIITQASDFQPVHNRRILFAVFLGESGINLELYEFLKKIRLDPTCLEGCIGSVLIDGNSELYTKSVSREIVFSCNMAGCTFPGRPLVEGTASLTNFNIQAMNLSTDNINAYLHAARSMVEKLMTFTYIRKKRPSVLVLHASNYRTSNTINLWQMIKAHLGPCDIREISIRNGSVVDCVGCPYKMCMHFSEQSNCFYGGVIVDDVYPAIASCDVLVLLCPNYNDAVSANIAAFINRLTALFRRIQFYDKYLFGVVVSGYSGSDLVAQQLISGLNMNKTFILPSRFAMMETANDAGSIQYVPDIQEKAKAFADNILDTVLEKTGETDR